ncbi:MAG: hypothetical protein EPO31_07990 [Gammaproteobacteria bacterium]|jgi:hypothetical protein|nr:MAG: hypothetical protein EPO31_07990 [Gammaproteobacteria bacterium]
MKLYSPDGSELMEIDRLERDGGELVIKGKVFASLPMTARLKPEDARAGLRLLNLRIVMFLISLLFRR